MVDLSGVYALEDFISNLEAKNIKTFVVNINSNISRVLDKLNFTENIGTGCYKKSTASVSNAIIEQYSIKED